MCVKITLVKSFTKNITRVCNVVYFRLSIDLMHITSPVTAEGCDGFHHRRCAECDDMISEVLPELPFTYIAHSFVVVNYRCSKQ